jgi:hypothetical protein
MSGLTNKQRQQVANSPRNQRNALIANFQRNNAQSAQLTRSVRLGAIPWNQNAQLTRSANFSPRNGAFSNGNMTPPVRFNIRPTRNTAVSLNTNTTNISTPSRSVLAPLKLHSTSVIMPIKNLSAPVTQLRGPTSNSQWIALSPVHLGLAHTTPIYRQFRIIRLKYRFVGILPDNSPGHCYAGYTPIHTVFTNTGTALSSTHGFTLTRSSTSSNWTDIITQSSSITKYLENDALLTTGTTPTAINQTKKNTQGYLYFTLAGGTTQLSTGGTITTAGTIHGHFEFDGLVELDGPHAG